MKRTRTTKTRKTKTTIELRRQRDMRCLFRGLAMLRVSYARGASVACLKCTCAVQ